MKYVIAITVGFQFQVKQVLKRRNICDGIVCFIGFSYQLLNKILLLVMLSEGCIWTAGVSELVSQSSGYYVRAKWYQETVKGTGETFEVRQMLVMILRIFLCVLKHSQYK